MTKIIYKSGNSVVTLESTQSYTTLRKKFTTNEFKPGEVNNQFEGYSMIKPENIVAIIEDESALTKKIDDKTVITAYGVNFYTETRMSTVVNAMETENLYLNKFMETNKGVRSLIKVDYIDAVTYCETETESAE